MDYFFSILYKDINLKLLKQRYIASYLLAIGEKSTRNKAMKTQVKKILQDYVLDTVKIAKTIYSYP